VNEFMYRVRNKSTGLTRGPSRDQDNSFYKTIAGAEKAAKYYLSWRPEIIWEVVTYQIAELKAEKVALTIEGEV